LTIKFTQRIRPLRVRTISFWLLALGKGKTEWQRKLHVATPTHRPLVGPQLAIKKHKNLLSLVVFPIYSVVKHRPTHRSEPLA